MLTLHATISNRSQTGTCHRRLFQAERSLTLPAIVSAFESDVGRLGLRGAASYAALAVLLLALGACGHENSTAASAFTVVELDSASPAPLQLAVQACAGLHSRRRGGSVYVQSEANDARWLEELELTPGATVGAADFLAACEREFPTCVRYSYATQQELLPTILTAASALGALPLDTGLAAGCTEVALDATVELADKTTRYLATQYAFENFLDKTTGLAMLNPGYDQDAADKANPPIVRDMPPALIDYVFSRKLFVVFLVNGCIDDNPEKELLSKIVNSGQWPTPLGVYGYNNSWLVGGYLYEAQTRCLDSRNMGAIPTETGNLSFFSTRRAAIDEPGKLEQNAPEGIAYDPARTYVAFVVGDGDNVRYIMTSRQDWLRQRLADCKREDSPCAPLTWTISPHLPELAPDVLEWYYRTSRQTGRDYFTLPPSGHLYAYPTSLRKADGDRFVAATERDAQILDVHATVHWDWFTTWKDAEQRLLPSYAKVDGVIRGIFPVNVPYVLPAFPRWPPEQFYRVLSGSDGGKVVVFRPREWRGIDGRDAVFFPSPETLAAELESYPPGTVTWVYMTSDGGLTLENSFLTLQRLLSDRVELVSTDTAARLALEAAAR